jgi:hypothetical protein
MLERGRKLYFLRRRLQECEENESCGHEETNIGKTRRPMMKSRPAFGTLTESAR